MLGRGVSSWGAAEVVALFATHGYSDAGEAVALDAVAEQARGRVLDLGIGGGRTTGLLAEPAAAYVGIDLAPEMVALARQRFPGVDLRVGNARDAADLVDLSAGGFDLVLWSFNGLDALDHDDRATALAAMARAVAPTGRVLFSSLNLDGVSFDERPWVLRHPTSRRSRWTLGQLARHPSTLVSSVRNYRDARPRSQDGAGWATRPLRAHEFRFVVHFATLAETVAEIRAAGLEVLTAVDQDGRAVDPDAGRTAADYVHYVCRRAPAPGPGLIGAEPRPRVAVMSVTSPTLRRAERHGRVRRLATYAAGSVVATGCSELTLVVCYGLFHLSAGLASVLAWVAGALPNYWLNRTWTWRRRGRPSLRREVLPYAAIILVTLLLAVAATHAVSALLSDSSDATRTTAVAATFFGVYVVMFVLRYFLLNRLFGSLSEAAAEPAPTSDTEERP